MFEDVTTVSTGRRRARRAVYAVSSAAIQIAAVVAIVIARPHRGEPPPRLVDVLIAPRAVAAPPPGPAPSCLAAARPKPRRTALTRPLEQPRLVPERPPPPSIAPEEEPVPPSDAAAEGLIGGGGSDGVIGVGAATQVSSAPPPPEPPRILPARPADLASVREGIARVLTYPPRAKRFGWAGRVVVAFTLLAHGAIRDLRIIERSQFELLDEAALEAVRRAAPFHPPGVDVLVTTPIVFQLQ